MKGGAWCVLGGWKGWMGPGVFGLVGSGLLGSGRGPGTFAGGTLFWQAQCDRLQAATKA